MLYKKGDWIVFPDFNKYPVQLEQSEKLGYIDHLYSGTIFVELSLIEAKEAGVNLLIAIRDPRTYPPGNICYGWTDVCKVRPATKEDFSSLIKSEKDKLKHCEKVLKMYERAMKSL